MLRARKDLGLSAVAGDAALAKVGEAIAALGLARTAMVAAHGQLEDTKLRLGIRTKMAGFDDKSSASVDHPRTDMRIAS
jgi:hypothetical protein